MAEGPTPFFVAACALSRRTQHSQAWVRVLRSFRVTSRTFSLYSSHTSRFSEICYQTPEVIAQKNSGLWAKSWHRTFSGTAHDLGLRCLGGGHETPPLHTQQLLLLLHLLLTPAAPTWDANSRQKETPAEGRGSGSDQALITWCRTRLCR